MSTTTPLANRLEQDLSTLTQLLKSDAAAVWTFDPGHGHLQITASVGLSPEYVAYANQVAQMPIAYERAPVYKVLTSPNGRVSGRSRYLKHLLDYFEVYDPSLPYCQMGAVALKPEAKAIGSLSFYFSTKHNWTEDYDELVQACIDRISLRVAMTVTRSELTSRIAELSEANAMLNVAVAEAQRVDALKDCFISTVSHELRTPMVAIVGYAELLEEGTYGELTVPQARCVTEVQSGVNRMVRVVDDLLDSAKIAAGEFKIFKAESDLASTVESVVRSLQPEAKRRGVNLGCASTVPNAVTAFDEARIEQVVMNLVSNALKFTPKGGGVSVILEEADEHFRVTVTDTGIGIPEDKLARVFDRFFQVDATRTREYGGTGLGLSITKALVEAHSGRISVMSREGAGSLFWFTIPR